MCRLSYELMQALKPNSFLSYYSLDLPHHYCCSKLPDRVFRYKHTFNSNGKTRDLPIGSVVQQRYDYNLMASKNIVVLPAFFGAFALNGKKANGFFRFPLYKTVEKHEYH